MRCPYCQRDNDRVLDSRALENDSVIRRRRECLACKRRFTTYERYERTSLLVMKKDGNRASFDRQKILAGLLKACEKRPVTPGTLEGAVDKVENEIRGRFEREVPTRAIGEIVMRELKRLDQVAYVRFASVYREFKDVDQFFEELQPMLRRGRSRPGGKRTS